MISPKRSQALGLVISAAVGLIVSFVVYKFVAFVLDFWYLGDVLALPSSIILGGLTAFSLFTQRLREVPLNWVGVSLFLGKPTGGVYENGIHWIPPFYGGRNVPSPDKKFIIEMPGEKIDAQDGSVIFFGISEDERKGSDVAGHKGKKNRLQISVIDPRLYIMMDDPEDELRESYLEEARLFFGQATQSVGVKNEKTLFSDFISLPPKPKPDDESQEAIDARKKLATFEDRLRNTKFTKTCDLDKKPANGSDPDSACRLFNDNSIIAIMDKAGNFLEKATSWGIGNVIAFTPNVRENPEAEAAAAQKTVAEEQMASLQTRANKIKELAGQMTKDNKVNPDLAATLVAGLEGQKVDVQNKTVNISGLPEVLGKLGEMAINKFGERKETENA